LTHWYGGGIAMGAISIIGSWRKPQIGSKERKTENMTDNSSEDQVSTDGEYRFVADTRGWVGGIYHPAARHPEILEVGLDL
jgi:hypothetical protein